MRTYQTDVVVVGGGAAGSLAAVAARRMGRSVTLIRRGDGATLQSSGAVDVAEYHDGAPVGPLRSALDPGASYLEAARKLAVANPFHPYNVVEKCIESIDEALAMLAEVAASAGLKGSQTAGQNLTLATVMGTVKRTAMAQASMTEGDWSLFHTGERVGVVHLPQLTQGDSANVIAVLTAIANMTSISGAPSPTLVLLEVDGLLTRTDSLRATRDVAARMETEEGERALTDALHRSRKGAGMVDRILIPPVLGTRGMPKLLEKLRASLGIPVAEMLSLPPSVPGERLQRALEDGVHKAGVEVLEGEVQQVIKSGNRVGEIQVRLGGEDARVLCGSLVLATGKYLSGGIRRDVRFFEPLLDLPVFIDGRNVDTGFVGDFVSDQPEQPQAFMRAGVLTDAQLRPLDAAAKAPVFVNVFAAGSVLAGYDVARQRSGLGVAAVTGMLAGRFAARQGA